MVARWIPVPKVACSIHVAFIPFLFFISCHIDWADPVVCFWSFAFTASSAVPAHAMLTVYKNV